MDNFENLQKKLVASVEQNTFNNDVKQIENEFPHVPQQAIDSLLYPEKYGPVVQVKDCTCQTGKEKCEINCLFDAIKRDKDGKLVISRDCTGCYRCVESCESGAIAGRIDLIPLAKLLKEQKKPVYAMIAPAFSGQFSAEVTSGKLRSAFKAAGFYGMIEVALFADILTLKEALEFDRSVNSDKDFLLTSCCCPLWVAMIKKKYASLIPHVPPSVSPMVACGRSIKRIHPEALTVFIGPCIAKKAEAREPDVADAVDYVLTFQETAELFETCGIDPSKMPEDRSDQSSRAGRIYARTSGVSEAVQTTLEKFRPGRSIAMRSQQADGVIECKKLLSEISIGEIHANFIEGMGCFGGCVGGPKKLVSSEEATEYVNEYGNAASTQTPVDNPHVLDILHKLGFNTVEDLLDRDNTFTRDFRQK